MYSRHGNGEEEEREREREREERDMRYEKDKIYRRDSTVQTREHEERGPGAQEHNKEREPRNRRSSIDDGDTFQQR